MVVKELKTFVLREATPKASHSKVDQCLIVRIEALAVF
jgi:hypothetical protein